MWHSLVRMHTQSHKTVLKEFKSNFPYLLWIFMWYRIICLSNSMFIIVVLLIWCFVSTKFLFTFALWAQVYDFAWHFLIHSIYWKGAEKNNNQTLTRTRHNKWNEKEKTAQLPPHIAEALSSFIYLLTFFSVTCYNNNKLKTFVMFIKVCECGNAWAQQIYENSQHIVCGVSLKCHNEIHFHSKKSHVSVRNCAS